MATFLATILRDVVSNGIKLSKNMTAEFQSDSPSLGHKGGADIAAAFIRQHGVDLKKAGQLTASTVSVKKK